MDTKIEDFIRCKRIAVVGYSRNARKFGNAAFAELRLRGYEVYAVHPVESEIRGVPCAPSLSALKGQIDAVLVSVPPAQAVSVLAEAAAIGVTNIWLQQGAESPEVFQTAERLGLHIVSKKCVLMYAPPVRSIHRWHRGLAKIIGRL